MSDVTKTYRQPGPSGVTVPAAGPGCNSRGVIVPTAQVPDVVQAALDAGVTVFDVSDTYGSQPGESEDLLGQALGSRRDEVVVATTFGMDTRGLTGPDLAALQELVAEGKVRYFAQPSVASVISAASGPEQVRSTAAALWEPEAGDLALLDQITGGARGRPASPPGVPTTPEGHKSARGDTS